MRRSVLFVFLLAAACAAPAGPSQRLTPANSATELTAGGPLAMRTTSRAAPEGQDPTINMTLSSADGRAMAFQQANHTPHDVMAQAPGGPLAQAMGFFGEEAPTLWRSADGGEGAPFLCGPEGPVAIGYYRAEDGQVSVVGLKSTFDFETLPDGTSSPLPFSPDHVCARLRFREG